MDSHRRKILWHSNAPWAATGYGQQTAIFAPKLAADHDLRISAFFGLEGGRLEWEGIQVMPNAGTNFGNDVIQSHARSFFGHDLRAGLVLTLMDTFVLAPDVWQQLNTAAWVPIDHDPPPPGVMAYFRGAQAIPIAMSRFGQELLAEFDPLYVPHGIDTKTFYPRNRKTSRNTVGLPDEAFVIGVVAANKGVPSRKSLPEILEAFARFRKRHEDACLYLHTELTTRWGGVDLPKLLTSLDLGDGSVLFCDQYRNTYNPWPDDYMAKLYSSFDVLLNPSKGEGFGIPMIEAQACGCPVIASDFSAMKEVVGAGWKVECDPFWTHQNSWQVTPRPDDILEALEACYILPSGPRKSLSERAVAHAADYDAELVYRDHFAPALDAIEERLDARRPVTVAP